MSDSDPSGPSRLTDSVQSQQSGAGTQGSFWGESPGLRRLTIAAAALTVSALALPVLLPRSAAPTAEPPAPIASVPATAVPTAAPAAVAPQAATTATKHEHDELITAHAD